MSLAPTFTMNFETTTSSYSYATCQGSSDPSCDTMRYLTVLFIFLFIIFFLSCGYRCLINIIHGKDVLGCRDCWRWRQSDNSSDADIFYPREERETRGNQNFGFSDPPPRYDQIFKRGGRTPTVITTRQPPASISSTITIEPPAYEHIATRSQTTTSSIYPISVEAIAIDMEHPAMPSPSESIDNIEDAMADIQNHAHACVQRYDSAHAAQVIASTTSEAGTSSPPVEGGPPCYDTISIRSDQHTNTNNFGQAIV